MQAADPPTTETHAPPAPRAAEAEAVPLETPAHPEAETAEGEPKAFKHPVSLSPSRASDFMTCPLLYRLRVIDKLPEPPSPAATRGTLIHSVLERLFDAPQGARTPDAAKALLRPQWERLLEERPEVAGLFPADATGADAEELASWLAGAEQLLASYFRIEDPNRLQPAERELLVTTELESGLTLRGYVDRIDVAPTGEVRVVDYKTGRAPSRDFEGKAMFQMKFYALVIWRERGVLPKRLQLMYLGGGGQVVTYDPDEGDLLATERKLQALWQAIQRALETGEWPANPNRLCDWCAHKSLCPAWGGTPPAYPLADTLN
jgi:putative RecB family exonuclease